MTEPPSDPSSSSGSTKDVTVPEPGVVLGTKYRVESVLGKGGMGVVVSAKHTVLGHRVAIKLLSSAGKANKTALARFLREAQATVELKSEHVVRVLDEGTTEDGAPFLVMEYLEGDDLMEVLIKRGPLPTGEAVEYLLQACDAMCEAHALGIVHRDLKPSNLFLTKRADGRPLLKVLDFGISKLAPELTDTELTETMAMLGSPTYMSPEQVKSSKNVDRRADVWALGVVLFRLLTKRVPFDGPGGMAMCASILRDAPHSLREFRPDVPAELEAVVMRCLEKDPNRRFQDVTELGRALVPFAPDGVTAARFRTGAFVAVDAPRAPREPSGRASPSMPAEPLTHGAVVTGHSAESLRPKPRRTWVALLAVAGLALAVGGVLVATRNGEPPKASADRGEAKLDPETEGTPKKPSQEAESASAALAPASATAAPAPSPSPSLVVAASAAPSATTKPKPLQKQPIAKPKSTLGTAIDDPL